MEDDEKARACRYIALDILSIIQWWQGQGQGATNADRTCPTFGRRTTCRHQAVGVMNRWAACGFRHPFVFGQHHS